MKRLKISGNLAPLENSSPEEKYLRDRLTKGLESRWISHHGINHQSNTKILFSLEATLPALPEKTENTNESTIMFFLNEKGRIADSYYNMSSTATTLVTSLAAPALPKLAGTFCRQDNQQCNAMIWVQLTEVVFFIVINCN